MAVSSLTSRYRPQQFKEIVGQEFIRKILSRACQEDRPASAYLFSGTRGVGKTTAARIMAKAVNCLNGPGPEPCNECTCCVQVTSGASPDVLEIDAASHTGVDNVRKLREDALYSPMSSRYRVIIIDEAHMLSRGAFNALLKTLEEPPKHCIFIMATTAPEKFPPTVVSRCQHYVFKMVPLDKLSAHLERVLEGEKIDYDQEAVRLIARKGAGSVRDSMSILSQVAALGGERLDAATVRQVLGLAGSEIYQELFTAVINQDLPLIHNQINDMLGQGLDISFFLQEFASCWRNLFLLSMSGDKAARVLDLPDEELQVWRDLAAGIPARIIHAGWQMVAREQKSIIQSNEPGLNLELLLFNLAYLRELLPVENFASEDTGPDAGPKKDFYPNRADLSQAADRTAAEKKSPESGAEPEPLTEASSKTESGPPAEKDKPQAAESWNDFLQYCSRESELDAGLLGMLRNCSGRVGQGRVSIDCPQRFIFETLHKNGRLKKVQDLVHSCFGTGYELDIQDKARTRDSAFKERTLNHPVVKKAVEDFNARIIEIKRIEKQ